MSLIWHWTNQIWKKYIFFFTHNQKCSPCDVTTGISSNQLGDNSASLLTDNSEPQWARSFVKDESTAAATLSLNCLSKPAETRRISLSGLDPRVRARSPSHDGETLLCCLASTSLSEAAVPFSLSRPHDSRAHLIAQPTSSITLPPTFHLRPFPSPPLPSSPSLMSQLRRGDDERCALIRSPLAGGKEVAANCCQTLRPHPL